MFDGFKNLIVCIDYFLKWLKVKAIKGKSAPAVASFLYEIICRHGCIDDMTIKMYQNKSPRQRICKSSS